MIVAWRDTDVNWFHRNNRVLLVWSHNFFFTLQEHTRRQQMETWFCLISCMPLSDAQPTYDRKTYVVASGAHVGKNYNLKKNCTVQTERKGKSVFFWSRHTWNNSSNGQTFILSIFFLIGFSKWEQHLVSPQKPHIRSLSHALNFTWRFQLMIHNLHLG